LITDNGYPLTKKGIPTTKGIEQYVKDNKFKLADEFSKFVHDSVYDIEMIADDISQYDENPDVLGLTLSYKGSGEIIITNEEKYYEYELDWLPKYKKRSLLEANNFVKTTILHELTHIYFNQVIREMRMDSMYVNPAYNNFSLIPIHSFGSLFLEEGIAVYIPYKMGQAIVGPEYIPESTEEIQSKDMYSIIMYKYSLEYVQGFLDYYGIKKGIQMLVAATPPNMEELLYPSKYYYKFNKTQPLWIQKN
jgi:hypothetical protein